MTATKPEIEVTPTVPVTKDNLPELVGIIAAASRSVLAAAEAQKPIDPGAARICALVAAMTAKEVRAAQAASAATIPA